MHIPFRSTLPPQLREGWRQITVTLTRNEITYAVDFETAKVAQVMSASAQGDKQRRVSDFQTGKDTKDWLDQQIFAAVANLKSSVGGMAVYGHDTAVSDRTDWERTEWPIVLRVSVNWTGTAEEAVRHALDYTVAYVLSRWYAMVEPQRVSGYEERASKAKAEFRDVVTRSIVKTQYW